jgi:hypothetical protein
MLSACSRRLAYRSDETGSGARDASGAWRCCLEAEPALLDAPRQRRDTLAVMELAVLAVVYVALGALWPRWTTLLAALIPAVFAFLWLLLHEDVPGDVLGFADLAWYVGMSLAVGAVYALAAAGGLVLGRDLRRLFGPLSH